MLDHAIDFMLSQEPYSINGQVRGFGLSTSNLVIGNTTNGERPMACIVCNPKQDPMEFLPTKDAHFTTIIVNTTIGPLVIISGYFQCAHKENPEKIEPYIDKLTAIINKHRGKMIIIGIDANAHSQQWNSETEDQKGEFLSNFITAQNLMIVNREGQPSTHKSGTNIDITLCSNNLFSKIESWTVHLDESLSDHRLITFEIELEQLKNKHLTNIYNIKKANYDMLNQELERTLERTISRFNMNSTHAEIEDMSRQVRDDVQRACEHSIPKKMEVTRKVPWWTPALTAQRIRVKRARREYQRCCLCRIKLVKLGRYRRENRTYKNLIKHEKARSWQSFVAEATNIDPYSLAYKLGSEKLKLREAFTTLRKDQISTSTNIGTIRLLLDSLVPTDDNRNEDERHTRLRANMQNHATCTNLEELFSLSELDEALHKAKNKRSAGPDKIPAEVYKNLTNFNKVQLLNMFNYCWNSGVFPSVWKVAKLKVIRKAGNRNWENPNAHRPISLLPTLGKIFERMVGNRLTAHLEDNDTLSRFQYGFRSGRSTVDAIAKVKHTTKQSQRKYVIVILVDIKGAFDALWWPVIFNRLRDLNVSLNIFNLMRSYLSDRVVILEHDGESLEREMTRGCPQGSVLGPTLWNITFDTLLTRQFPEDTTPIAFADDVAFVIEGDTRRVIEGKGNRLGELITEWATENKMAIAVDKTKGLLLKGKLNRPPCIRINGTGIQFVQKAPYLGVILDTGLTFLPHVKAVTEKAKALFGKITRLIRIKYGVKPHKLLFLYKTVYVPIISYAFRVWEDRLEHSHVFPKIRESQRQVLRNVSGAYCTTSLHALCALTRTMPIYLKLRLDLQLQMASRGEIQTSKRDLRMDYNQRWQEEWSTAVTGRYTHHLFPDLEELAGMKHLHDLGHIDIQLLTGHGAFGTYLHHHNKRPDPFCEDCGERDSPEHPVIDCPAHQDLRDELADQFIRMGEAQPWCLGSALRNEQPATLLLASWREIFRRRNL